jgi:hypothetical protein
VIIKIKNSRRTARMLLHEMDFSDVFGCARLQMLSGRVRRCSSRVDYAVSSHRTTHFTSTSDIVCFQ